MKNLLTLIALVIISSPSFSQTEMLLIGQTFGQMEMHDGEELFTFGFIEDYGDPLLVPGPILYMTEGDSVILDFHNLSAIPHTIHLHGLDVNQANDGVPQTSFQVEQDEHGYYHMTVPHPGTYIYHCHYVSSIHVQSGMYGLVIVHPQSGTNITWEGGYEFDHDLSFMTFEFDSDWHTFDILNQQMGDMVVLPPYDPEYFMINGFSEQQLEENGQGIFSEPEEVNHVRFSNMGYYANRLFFPEGLDVQLIASDGRPIPGPLAIDSLWVLPGERYDALISSGSPFEDQISFEYINMDNHLTESTQYLDVLIETATGVDQEKELEFDLYPNPAMEYFHIQSSIAPGTEVRIEISDEEGRIVKSIQKNSSLDPLQINIDYLASGFYLVMLSTMDASITRTLIVQ